MPKQKTEKTNTDDVFNNIFSVEDERKEKSELDILNELFTAKDIKTKTELNVKQIVMMNQKRTISKLLGWGFLDETLNDFMLLMVSKDRKGRGEFVDGFKSNRENEINKNGGGFMSGIKNKLGF